MSEKLHSNSDATSETQNFNEELYNGLFQRASAELAKNELNTQKQENAAMQERQKAIETSFNTPKEVALASAERAASDEAAKSFFGRKLAAAAGLLAIGITAGVAIGSQVHQGKEITDSAPRQESTSTTYEDIASTDNLGISGENAEHIGIYDGYNEKGMFASKNKGGDYDFACAAEVAEVCNGDEVEMVKYTAENQSESMSDYLANLPESLQPEGFKGLSILETEKKLENLSDEEYEAVQADFNKTMDAAFTRRVPLNGQYENSYMRKMNADGSLVHENMELVACKTNENGVQATEFYWLDEEGNEIGSMTAKILLDENGNIKGCIQIVNRIGEKAIYVDMERLPDPDIPTPDIPTPDTPTPTPVTPDNPTPTPVTPDNPTPTPVTPDTPTPTPVTPDTPTPTPDIPEEPEIPPSTPDIPEEPEEPIIPEIPPDKPVIPDTGTEGTGVEVTPKDPKPVVENAGPRVDQQELDVKVTPETTEEQDKQNLEAIEKQKQEDAERKAEAERRAAEQAEAERKAAEEAEARRKAEEEAAAKRSAEEAEAERQRQAEADAARQKAEAEAAEAQRQAAEAEQRAAAERAAREAEQAEADRKNAENSDTSQSNADNNAEQRADDFENGNY